MRIIRPMICGSITYTAALYLISRAGLLQGMKLPPFGFSEQYWEAMAAAPFGNILEVLLPFWLIMFFWVWIFNRKKKT